MIATSTFGTKLTTSGNFSLVMGYTSLNIVNKSKNFFETSKSIFVFLLKLVHETKNDKTEVEFCLIFVYLF